MPILRLNAGPGGLQLDGSPASPTSAIQTAAAGTGPVIVMVHGFKYDPFNALHSPHFQIFAHKPQPNRPSKILWLPHLGFGARDQNEGLAIAFGWCARGTLWAAQRSARIAGQHLAQVIAQVRCKSPHRPIHVIAHSMGSEVILEALGTLPPHAVQRIVTLTGASFTARVETMMQTPAGKTAELFNITSRENDLFDFTFEQLMMRTANGDRAMGIGLSLPNAVNIQLDCARTLACLSAFGGSIGPAQRRICHWSAYTRRGALQFYAHLMRCTDETPLRALQAALPRVTHPRWSRMIARPQLAMPLPTARKPAS